MKIPKRGEKGFTLIELLIVVAILGVLAAVVIPNVGRFIGKGKSEAQKTELANIQSAVLAMMVDNNLSTLPNPVLVGTATDNMSKFPDTTAAASKGKDPEGGTYNSSDKAGFILYRHDIHGGDGSSTNNTVNYVASEICGYKYYTDSGGTVYQVSP